MSGSRRKKLGGSDARGFDDSFEFVITPPRLPLGERHRGQVVCATDWGDAQKPKMERASGSLFACLLFPLIRTHPLAYLGI